MRARRFTRWCCVAPSNPPKRLRLCHVAEAQSKAKLIELAPALYDAISPVEHGAGVLAEIEFETPPWPKQIVDDAIYLDNVQDPAMSARCYAPPPRPACGTRSPGRGARSSGRPKSCAPQWERTSCLICTNR